MSDVFVEQLVKREDDKSKIRKILYATIGGVVSVLSIGFLFQFAIIIVPLVGLAVYYLFRRENIEYEYIFTSGELDIDKIINQSSRKRIMSLNVREIELMVKFDLEDKYGEFKNITKVLDFSSGTQSEDRYIALFKREQDRVKMIFDPNEQVFKSIKAYIPNKIKK